MLEKGELEEARALAALVLDYNKQSASAYFIRAEAFRLQGKYAAALDDLGFCLAIGAQKALHSP
jgi:tetratricopeptide (TPR) repeat protein